MNHVTPAVPQQPAKPRVWPWVVGGVVVVGGAIGITWWLMIREAKKIGTKVFTAGVGEDCPVLRWEFVSSSTSDVAGDHQMTIYRVKPGREATVISSAPMSPSQAGAEILSQLQSFTKASRCRYTLRGDDLNQIVAGRNAQGEYVPVA